MYFPVAASKLALPGTTAVPTSDWPSKIPIGILKCVLARRKSGGGGTWVRVAVPGYAQSGACGLAAGLAGAGTWSGAACAGDAGTSATSAAPQASANAARPAAHRTPARRRRRVDGV